MPSTKFLLLTYDDLAEEERVGVDAHLRAHPEDRALIAEGRRIRELLRAAASDEITDEDLAAVILARACGEKETTGMQATAARIDDARSHDPEVDERYATLESRLETISAELPSAHSQFARLTGETGDRETNAAGHHDRTPSRGARAPLRRARFRGVIIALVATASLIGLFALLSDAIQPSRVQVAALHQLPATYEPPRLRSEAYELPQAVQGYASALETIHASRRTTLGLLPRYDGEGLRSAMAQLEGVMNMEPQESAFGLEAAYALARIHLHMGDIEAARQHLDTVVRLGGPSAPEAATILESLDRL